MLAEVKSGCDEVALNKCIVSSFRLSITSRCDIAEPVLNDLAVDLRVGLDLDHDAHLGVEYDGVGYDRENGLGLFFLLCGGLGVRLACIRRLVALFLTGGTLALLLLGSSFLGWGCRCRLAVVLHIAHPLYFHLFSATVLKEKLFGHVLMGVFGAEVDEV